MDTKHDSNSLRERQRGLTLVEAMIVVVVTVVVAATAAPSLAGFIDARRCREPARRRHSARSHRDGRAQQAGPSQLPR